MFLLHLQNGFFDFLMGRPSISDFEEHDCASTQQRGSENSPAIPAEIMENSHQRQRDQLIHEVQVLVQPECSRRPRSVDVASLCGQILRVMGDEQVSHTCGRHLRCMGDHLYHNYTLHKLLPESRLRNKSRPTNA